MTRASLAWIKDSSADLEAQRGRGDSTGCGGWAKSRVTGWLIKKGDICSSSKKTLGNNKEVPKVWFIIIPILLKLWKVSLIEFELLLNISLDRNWRQIVFLSKFLQSNSVAETRALCANHHGDCQAWRGPSYLASLMIGCWWEPWRNPLETYV